MLICSLRGARSSLAFLVPFWKFSDKKQQNKQQQQQQQQDEKQQSTTEQKQDVRTDRKYISSYTTLTSFSKEELANLR